MLEKSFGLFFFLKATKKQNSAQRYVYIRITVDGIPREISTKRIWSPERWNAESGRATGSKEDAKTLNAYLDTLAGKVYDIKTSLILAGKPVTAEIIKCTLSGKSDNQQTLLKLFKIHNDNMAKLVGEEFAPATLTRYQTTYDHVHAFLQFKYNLEDISIHALDYEFVSEFALWLKTIRKCNHNSTVKYIANTKKIILDCIKKGWLQRDPFTGFKTTKKKVKKTALTEAEISKISKKKFGNERLGNVRDIFLFSCYTGLAYADVKKLTKHQIITGVDHEKWIVTERQKTDSPTRLPLLPQAMEILKKYKNHPKCAADGAVLPVLTNQKMNAYLKEIADLCGINKPLTFHIARHTFATTVTLSNGVPIETVSKMLGHESVKQTEHYAEVVDLKISKDMRALKAKLNKTSLKAV